MQLRCACVEPLLLPAGWSRGFLSFKCSSLCTERYPRLREQYNLRYPRDSEELQGPIRECSSGGEVKVGQSQSPQPTASPDWADDEHSPHRDISTGLSDILTSNVFLQDPPETRIYANYLVIQYIWSKCSLREFYQDNTTSTDLYSQKPVFLLNNSWHRSTTPHGIT